MFSERVQDLLADIVSDADRMANFLGTMNADDLASDERTLLAVERLFQRITEAVIKIGPADMQQIGDELPVKQIRDFGNRLRHDYRNIDPEILIRTARHSLPLLRSAAARALEE